MNLYGASEQEDGDEVRQSSLCLTHSRRTLRIPLWNPQGFKDLIIPRRRSFLVGQRHFKGFCHFIVDLQGFFKDFGGTFNLQRYDNVSIGKNFDLQRFVKGFRPSTLMVASMGAGESCGKKF